MDAAEKLEAVLRAVTTACEGQGDGLVVNLDTLAEQLFEVGIPTKTLNRGALLAELSVVRDEQRVQRVRGEHGEDSGAVVAQLKRREDELIAALWPAGKAI